MAIIEVSIRNNLHRIACEDGEEQELRNLAAIVDKRVKKLSDSFPNVTDLRLLLMSAIMAEDELQELKKRNQQLSMNLENSQINDNKTEYSVDLAVSQALDAVSEYVENLVMKFEK